MNVSDERGVCMQDKKSGFSNLFNDSLISNIGNKENNFVVVKHYSTFNIVSEDAKGIMMSFPNINTYYHNFDASEMVETFEPFLNVIKNFYLKYFFGVTIDEFLSEFNIYPLQKSFFKSYIESGSCSRNEPFILGEIDFEKKKMVESVADIILKLSEAHPILVLINNLQLAPKSTILLLDYLFNHENNKNLGVFCAYNDLKTVTPYMQELWNDFIEKLSTSGCIFEGGAYQMSIVDDGASFTFNRKNVFEYLMKLRSMYYALDFEPAQEYMHLIYGKLEIEKVEIDLGCKLDLYILYAKVLVYSGDIPSALLVCDNIKELCDEHPELGGEFDFYNLLGYTNMFSGKLEQAAINAKRCRKVAVDNKDEYKIFQADLLALMVQMSGWHNVFFLTTDTEVSEDFIEHAQEYGYYNHLAYIYIFAFDNDKALFENIKNPEYIEDRLLKFSEGIDLAQNIGNRFLILRGYRKIIMMTSANGYFDITKYYYYKSQDIIGDSDKLQSAGIYNGLGYFNCTTYNFKKANEWYNKALDIYIELGRVDFIGETFYNMALNSILANDFRNAYNYLLVCVRVIKSLRLNDLRVCNIAKIFGLLSLCSVRMGYEYNCILYLDTNKQFLSHLLTKRKDHKVTIDKSYTGNDDEMFLYYYVNGIQMFNSRGYAKALEFFKSAQVHCYNSYGNMFFSLIQLKISMAKTYEKLNQAELEQIEYAEALEYAKKHKYKVMIPLIESMMNHESFEFVPVSLPLKNHSIEQINAIIKEAGANRQYMDMKNQIEFISMWQNIIEINDKTKEELISSACNSFMMNYNLDSLIYIKFGDEKNTILFNNGLVTLDDSNILLLKRYFEKQRSGFVTSKIMKNHKDYSKIMEPFGKEMVCSMVCNPYFMNEKLDSLFVSTIYMKDNWNVSSSKYLLNESEFNIFNLILRQLLTVIEKIENINKISQINYELQKSSVTDYLTGLNNRDGFYGKVDKLIRISASKCNQLSLAILYIDLDNFKFYNDTFGHDVGDLILKEIAAVLKSIAGNEGFATRYGGDEFLITLVNVSRDNALATARMTLDTILAKNSYVSQISAFLGKQISVPREKSVSCSIGVSYSENVESEEDLSQLIKNADEVLYSIKHTTKNDVRIYEG